MYVVMNFGVFVCSNCAGIHREMTHKVKGISMSNFSETEMTFLIENGNAVSFMAQDYANSFLESTNKDNGRMVS